MSAGGKLMNRVAGVVIFATLTGCSPITPMDISGSKADGTVVMGATVSLFGSISWEEAEAMAARRCARWGYRGASAFSGVQERCIDADCFFQGDHANVSVRRLTIPNSSQRKRETRIGAPLRDPGGGGRLALPGSDREQGVARPGRNSGTRPRRFSGRGRPR